MHNQLAEYLSKHKDRIEEHYSWRFNETIPRDRFGFTFSNSTRFRKTLELKRQLREAARSSARSEEKEQLADYFIKEWGGIKRISIVGDIVTRCDSIAGKQDRAAADFDFENISSWSKWLSIRCEWALIYDARVTYSLNAINYITHARSKIFPMPSGRNTIMKLLDAPTLVLSRLLAPGDVRDAKSIRKTYFWTEDQAYLQYLDLIRKTSQKLWKNETPMEYTEMLLFALADTAIFNDLLSSVAASSTRG